MKRLLTLLLAAAMLAATPATTGAGDGCYATPVGPNTPTGVAGCTLYGSGIASRWHGPGVARNDCTWPWRSCQPIRITSLRTGRSIVVVPSTFCDCYTGTANQRLVDLGPAAVAALGLLPSRGLYPVQVEPVKGQLPPDTSTEPFR